MSRKESHHWKLAGMNVRSDAVLIFALALFVIVLFSRTVFGGESISKIFVIAEWDSVFDRIKTGQSLLMDPSLILLMVPYYLYVGKLWHGFDLPLWNPNSGFGTPLLADPQSLALSPLHLPMAFDPSIGTYNLVLIIELIVLLVGGYLLGRSLELSRICAIFLGVTLFACPYEQWYLELLGNGYCLIPLLLYSFTTAAKEKTDARAVGAGVVSAVFLLSAHPELSFCSIMFASMLFFILTLPTVKEGIRLLSIAGGTAFCLSAPMLLPFIEFLMNSESYKFGNRAPAYIPWQTLGFGLFQPGFSGASPFLGVVAVVVLPLVVFILVDIFRKRGIEPFPAKVVPALSILSIAGMLISAKVWPLGMILRHKPFCYLVVTYVFPVLLVMIASLAAIGFQRALSLGYAVHDKAERRFEWIVMVLVVVGIWLFPTALKSFNVDPSIANFDMTLPTMALQARDWVRNGALATALVILIGGGFVLARREYKYLPFAVGIFCVAIGLVSELAISKKSLPVRPPFTYAQTNTVVQLRTLGGRYIATGPYTLRPNTNLAYGLKDIRFHNPIFPARYLTFMKECGAKLDEFNQVFGTSLSPLIDLASVKYIVTPVANTITSTDRQVMDGDSSKPRFEMIDQTSEGLRIYRNNNALPEAYVVTKAIYVDSEHQALEKLREPNFDGRSEVVIESNEKAVQQLRADCIHTPGDDDHGEARLKFSRRGTKSLAADVRCAEPAFLVVTDLWYPGWQATIDGAPTEILHANHAFRAIAIPAGRHEVDLRYWPYSFMLGSSFALMLALAALIVKMKPKRIKR